MNRDPLGVLVLHLHRGRILGKTESISGEINAQVDVEIEGKKYRTKNNKHGANPVWNEEFTFEIYSFNEGL